MRPPGMMDPTAALLQNSFPPMMNALSRLVSTSVLISLGDCVVPIAWHTPSAHTSGLRPFWYRRDVQAPHRTTS